MARTKIEKLLSCADASNILGIHPKTLGRWLREGKVEGVFMGNRWKIKESEIIRISDPKNNQKYKRLPKDPE